MSSASVFLEDEAATERFGRLLAAATSDLSGESFRSGELPAATSGGCIYLSGDLGAGKTTLTRGLMRGYGFQGAVKSPTYTLVEPYEFSRYKIYHFDLYRLSYPGEVEFLGVSEYFDDDNLCLVEWPEHGGAFLPPADLVIYLSMEGRGRRLNWQSRTPRGQKIADRIEEFSQLR
jgi:tRNA threonylcarbamoyladenosine biosynthesis protein TsaE